MSRERVFSFGSLDTKQEQRYYAGIGPRKFQFQTPERWLGGIQPA